MLSKKKNRKNTIEKVVVKSGYGLGQLKSRRRRRFPPLVDFGDESRHDPKPLNDPEEKDHENIQVLASDGAGIDAGDGLSYIKERHTEEADRE